MQATSPAVLAIIAINVAVYVLEFVLGDPFIIRFASAPANVAFRDEYYRLITPMFLHAPLGASFGILHILFNMYILRIYGPQVEGAFGTPRFSVMYLTAGFVAGAASMAFGGCGTLGLGASGAVFGVVGVLVAFLYRRRGTAFVGDYLRSLMFFVGINIVFGFSVRGIDNFAHLGGLGAGLLMGFGMDEAQRRGPLTPRQIATMAVVIAIGIGLVAWRVSTMPVGCIAAIR
jgi:rhomboid protease GluP